MAASPVDPHASNVRVQDYLNDKFQTLSDLDSLDSLLSSVQAHQEQLRSQFTAAESAASTARERLENHSQTLYTTVASFNHAQTDIDRRLRATTTADTAKDAAEVFSATIENLRRLDVARGYIDLLQKVQTLSAEARKFISKHDPQRALGPYTKLQTLAQGLKERNEASEGAAVHLVDYVEKNTREIWEEMKGKLAGALEDVLKKVSWPTEQPKMKGNEKEFTVAFEKLLMLQGTEVNEGPLLPLEVLVKPLALRFRYHFESDRPTNRVDKSEWFLAHVTGLVTSYGPFLTEYVQPILDISSNPAINSRDSITEFITALLPVLQRKIRHLLPQIIDQAQLLSHFIHEMIKFDDTLREEFYYVPYGCDGAWKGMTYEVLVVEDGFPGWLKVEKEFALSRYHAILAAEDAWVLDYDSVDAAECKPTKSAMRLTDLLENVTNTYRPLISFSQRLRFLIDIQISILDQYHDRLSSSVEAFRVLSSSIARAVQGTRKEEVASFSGLSGLERLCKAYGSSMFIENCMRDWGEDIFFLELWEDLQTRASKANPAKQIAGTMSVRDVATITSSAVGSGVDDGALFDETAGSYKNLRNRTEEMMVELFTNSIKEDLRSYLKISLWSSLDSSSVGAISPELVSAASTLASYSAFLQRTLSPGVFRRISRQFATSTQTYIWDYVIMRNQFSLAGGKQLERDMNAIWEVGGKITEEYMGRIREALGFLTLEVDELRKVVKEVFEDGQEAKRKAAELGVSILSVAEMRRVLQRRVEAWAP